jgi:flagellar hook-length control protein FliK
MNISRDPNKLTAPLNFDIKTSLLDGVKSPEAPVVSFGEVLKREADSFVQKFESPQSYESPTPAIEQNKQQANASILERQTESKQNKLNETNESIQEDVVESKDEGSETEELEATELDLGSREIEFFSNILAFQPNTSVEIKKVKEENSNLEKPTFQYALLKNNEKQSPYTQASKENTSFIEDAKKLAESIFKKDKKESKGKTLDIPIEAKTGTDKTSFNKEDVYDSKFLIQKGNVVFANFHRTKQGTKTNEKVSVGSISTTSASIHGKEVVKKEIEVPTIQNQISKDLQSPQIKENTFSKEIPSKKKNSIFSNELQEDKKSIIDVQGLNEKISRNLGVKDKEFAKTETKPSSTSEKMKSKEQIESVAPVNISSVQMKEESGQTGSGAKNGSSGRDNFLFSNETKILNRAEELSKSEKTSAPSKQEMQKNLEELVKQARFDIVQNGKSTAEIIMNPKEFGRLTLRVSVDGEKVEGRILVETEEMKELITNEIAKLRENLKDSGLSLESLLVDVWENTDSNFSNKNFEERKFAEEMINSSYNRSSSTDSVEELSTEVQGSTSRSNAIEMFA